MLKEYIYSTIYTYFNCENCVYQILKYIPILKLVKNSIK